MHLGDLLHFILTFLVGFLLFLNLSGPLLLQLFSQIFPLLLPLPLQRLGSLLQLQQQFLYLTSQLLVLLVALILPVFHHSALFLKLIVFLTMLTALSLCLHQLLPQLDYQLIQILLLFFLQLDQLLYLLAFHPQFLHLFLHLLTQLLLF